VHGVPRDEPEGVAPISVTAAEVGKANFYFAVTETDCAACHADPHQGRFASGGERAKAEGCRACHGTRAFRPSTAGVTAHAAFGFPLEGAHRATACSACHKELGEAPPARSSLRLAGTRFADLQFAAKGECADCHTSPHGRQFDGLEGWLRGLSSAEGLRRPTGSTTTPARPSRSRAPTSVPCAGATCASKRTDSVSVIYAPLSGKCETCHGKESR
jgi:hypothetical protein